MIHRKIKSPLALLRLFHIAIVPRQGLMGRNHEVSEAKMVEYLEYKGMNR
jgi:hypothetical protein